jgi:hypothetical protein
MCLDSVVISAIIGFFSVIVGIGGYALQNAWIKNREREKREYVIRRRYYEELVKKITYGIHTVQTKKEQTTPEFKEQLDEATNVLWLYASDDVLKALNAYFSSGETGQFQNLILAMRKDLKIETNLQASEIEWFRAT